MKGSPAVIAQLQKQLRQELAARDQYFTHSRRYQDWGLSRLYQRIHHEMEEETAHADALIQRILFLEGSVDLAQRDEMFIGEDVPSMLRNDLKVEYATAANLKEAIAVCEREGDYHSREVLETLLRDTEEDHAYWLEQQLGLIERMGLANYLQAMSGDGPGEGAP